MRRESGNYVRGIEVDVTAKNISAGIIKTRNKMYLLHILAISLLFYSCNAKEEDVLEFEDSDFDSKIAEHDTALVMFYAPW